MAWLLQWNQDSEGRWHLSHHWLCTRPPPHRSALVLHCAVPCCAVLRYAVPCCAVLCCAHKSYHSAFSLHLRPSHFAEKYRNSGRGIAPSGHVCFEHLHAALHSAVARLTCTVRGHTINDKNSCTHDNMNSKLEPKKTNLGLQGFAACCKCQRTELS